MTDLMRDLGLPTYQAAAILGNLGHESMGFTHLQEIHPVAGRGGLGWAQWTGLRRVAFEEFCKRFGYDTHSKLGNYAYLVHELKTTQSASIVALKATRNLHDAVITFERVFERAGVPALASRERWANIAIDAFENAARASSNAKSATSLDTKD